MDGSGWEYLERYSEDYDKHIEKLNKQIEHLQEQLKEANEVIKAYAQPIEVVIKRDERVTITKREPFCDTALAKKYLDKWGVK